MISQYSDIMTQYFTEVWRIFSVQVPYLGLTFGQITLGFVAVNLSIKVLKTLFASFDYEPSQQGKRYSRKDKNASESHD